MKLFKRIPICECSWCRAESSRRALNKLKSFSIWDCLDRFLEACFWLIALFGVMYAVRYSLVGEAHAVLMRGAHGYTTGITVSGPSGGSAQTNGSAPPPPSGDALLQEDGFYLLQEDGSKILLE